MYRVYVYRTNEEGQTLSYCISRQFGDAATAYKFYSVQNRKPNRKAEIVKR